MRLFDDEPIDETSDPLEALDLDSVRGALDELFLLARQYRRSDKYLELLRFVASFRRYSAFNAMLVHIQMPGAKYVLPAKRWMKKYKRQPVRNAQPLIMLQPMSPVMFGFDVSQTEGRELPPGFENPFEVSGRLKKEEWNMMVDNAKRDGVRVELKSLGSTLGGYVRNAASPYHCIGVGLVSSSGETMCVDDTEIPVLAEITLNANLPSETNFATLTHELGHLYCGHVGTPDTKRWPDRSALDRNTEEFEAESVSYLVCHRAGIVTPAAEYLHGYLGSNEKVPSISLEVVFKAVQRLEIMRSKKLKLRTLENEGE
jgi:hypothetical protein